MIDVPVVQYIGLTGSVSMWSLVHTVSRTWTRCCNAGTGVDVVASPIDETLLPRQVNLSTSFRGPPFSVEMSPL